MDINTIAETQHMVADLLSFGECQYDDGDGLCGCQEFVPDDDDSLICDLCGYQKGYHKLNTPYGEYLFNYDINTGKATTADEALKRATTYASTTTQPPSSSQPSFPTNISPHSSQQNISCDSIDGFGALDTSNGSSLADSSSASLTEDFLANTTMELMREDLVNNLSSSETQLRNLNKTILTMLFEHEHKMDEIDSDANYQEQSALDSLMEKRSEVEKEMEQTKQKLQDLGVSYEGIENTNFDEDHDTQLKKVLEQWSGDHFAWSSNVRRALTKIFGFKEFKPLQHEAINAVLAGNDVMCFMPTGGGKSLVYLLTAVLSRGVTVVISPLLSLINDQMSKLSLLGIRAIHFDRSVYSDPAIMQDLVSDSPRSKIIFITPEKLARSRETFQDMHAKNNIARFVVDECHVISQWGHDFRHEYRDLKLKASFPNIPIVALTAAASQEVIDDVMLNLRINNSQTVIFRASLNRENIHYEVRNKSQKTEKDILGELANWIDLNYREKCGIIYCTTIKQTKKASQILRDDYGINAESYHSHIRSQERKAIQDRWYKGKTDVIVATVAFGMGVDKRDVRFVIHYSMPSSLTAYMEESGRAGRDGEIAHSLIFYRQTDESKIKALIGRSDSKPWIRKKKLDSLHAVSSYCLNGKTCRRKMLLENFGQTFSKEVCYNCDNCMSMSNCETIDMTEECKDLLNIVVQTRESISRAILAKIYRGSSSKNIKERYYDNLEGYGNGFIYTEKQILVLVHHMISQKILTEKVSLANGTLSTKLMIGPRAPELALEEIPVRINLPPGFRNSTKKQSLNNSKTRKSLRKKKKRTYNLDSDNNDDELTFDHSDGDDDLMNFSLFSGDEPPQKRKRISSTRKDRSKTKRRRTRERDNGSEDNSNNSDDDDNDDSDMLETYDSISNATRKFTKKRSNREDGDDDDDDETTYLDEKDLEDLNESRDTLPTAHSNKDTRYYSYTFMSCVHNISGVDIEDEDEDDDEENNESHKKDIDSVEYNDTNSLEEDQNDDILENRDQEQKQEQESSLSKRRQSLRSQNKGPSSITWTKTNSESENKDHPSSQKRPKFQPFMDFSRPLPRKKLPTRIKVPPTANIRKQRTDPIPRQKKHSVPRLTTGIKCSDLPMDY